MGDRSFKEFVIYSLHRPQVFIKIFATNLSSFQNLTDVREIKESYLLFFLR